MMKKIYLLLFCFSFLSLNGQNLDIKLTKIKINSKDKYPFKGYLFDVDEEKVTLVSDKKKVKQYLISGNCKPCYTIPIDFIRDLKFPQKKLFIPYGLLATSSIGLSFAAAAGNTPNPDGVNERDWVLIYTAYGVALGGTIDLFRLGAHVNKKNVVDINMGLQSVLSHKSAVYQFNEQREEQLANLVNIFAHIEQNKKNYQKQTKVYTKNRKVIIGYIIGQLNGSLLLSPDKEKIREYRNNPPDNLNRILIENILYYEFAQ